MSLNPTAHLTITTKNPSRKTPRKGAETHTPRSPKKTKPIDVAKIVVAAYGIGGGRAWADLAKKHINSRRKT